jgi:DNA-binding NarL/FixJ family response regulator
MADALGEAGFDVTSVEDPTDWQAGRDGSALVMSVGDQDQLEVLQSFSDEHPHIPVVAVVSEVQLVALARVVRSGAVSAIDDHCDAESLALTVEGALHGLTVMPGRLAAGMAQLVPDDSELGSLVSTEQAMWLRSMAGGMTVADLAEDVGYSERAMFRNLKALYLRLGVQNRTEALIWATRNSVLADGSGDD